MPSNQANRDAGVKAAYGGKEKEEVIYDGNEKYACEKCHRISKGSDCNNLQCPFCGGNLREVIGPPRTCKKLGVE